MVTSGSEFPTQNLLKKCKNRISIFKHNNLPEREFGRSTQRKRNDHDVSHMCEKLMIDKPAFAAALLDSWRPNDSASAPVSPQFRRRTITSSIVPKSPRSLPVVIDRDVYQQQQPATIHRTNFSSVFNLSKSNNRIGCFDDARNDFSILNKNQTLKYSSAFNLHNSTTAMKYKKQRPLSADLQKTHFKSNVDLKKLLSNISSSMTNLHRKRSFKDEALRSSVLRSSHQKRIQLAEMVDMTSNISMEDMSGVLKNKQAFLLDVDHVQVEVVKSCCKLNSTLRTNKNAIRNFPCDRHNTQQQHNKNIKRFESHPSLRKSLKETISCKESRIKFADFLRNEFSEENLDFWLICEKYRFLPSADRKQASELIYDRFLKVSALSEINIDSKIRHNTEQRMKNPDAFCFQEAQQSVYELMKKDSYRRFMEANHL